MKTKHPFLRDVLLTIVGTLLYTVGIYFFTAPNKIAPGGVAGIATVVNYLWGAPIGLVNALINLPLLVLGYFYLGKGFVFKTVVSVVSFSIFQDYIFAGLPQFVGDPLLAGIFGGALLGAGTGLTFVGESSTGGLDISSKVIQKKFPYLKIGVISFISNMLVILFAAYAYQDITTALYAVITIFVASRVIDGVLYGMDVGKMVIIITSRGDEMAKVMISRSQRGVTKFKTVGAYTEQGNTTLLCAVRQNEYYPLKRLVNEIDPGAFMIVSTASEVVGKGFKALKE
ncbi:MAG: YitT family protein [Massiliimalia sp.]|jgi:uncharacterized membrane-anchored protein YitT (DUF2179 family)